MNGIIGMSHLVLETNLSPKQDHYVQKINNSANSLLGIINDVLDLSKIESGKFEIEKKEFDLFRVIDDVVHLLELKSQEKGLELLVSYDIKIQKNFYGDKLRLKQILTNLLSNAIKFTHQGEVGLYITQIEHGRYRFEVKDTGIGLTEKQQEKLFESFSQADGSTTREYGGTGLGLAISKQLVELMDGTIWVESVFGVRSSFIFEIVLVEKKNATKYKTFENKKVLIVDDSETWHIILRSALEAFDVEVVSVYSGVEALKTIKKSTKKYDLILMDWQMPQWDGIETAKEIRELCEVENILLPPTIVIVSSFSQESIVQEAQKVGIDIFLQKPINPSLLNNLLASLFSDTVNQKFNNQITHINQKEQIKELRGNRILLVEDNDTNQEIIIGLLEASGIMIDIANNGLEAVELYQESLQDKSKKAYKLILMDIQMPILDGYQATEKIRAIDSFIPIVALTANAMREDLKKTKQAGMNAHLSKPIEVENLYKILLEYLEKNKDISSNKSIEGDEVIIPIFNSIDTVAGLKNLEGNSKLYLKVVKGFAENYRNIDLESMESEEIKIVTHNIKGLSANIGAIKLHKVSKALDSTQDKKLWEEFEVELQKVISELQTYVVAIDKSITPSKKLISQAKRKELFTQLLEAVRDERPQLCEPLVECLGGYALNKEDNQILLQTRDALNEYDFDEALEVLEQIVLI